MFSIKPVDRASTDAVVLRDFCLAATWRFEVPDQIFNLLPCQFRLGAKLDYTNNLGSTALHSPANLDSTGNGFRSTLHRPFPDQFSFELANCSKYVELQAAIHGSGVDTLI